MRHFCLDGRWMQRTKEGYDYIYETLGVLECVGKNLDALYDCLTEMGRNTEIEIDHPEDMDQMIKKVILNAAKANECLKIILTK